MGKRRPSTSSSAPSAAAIRRATASTRRPVGGSPWVPGITSRVARWCCGIVEPEELDGAGGGRRVVGELRHRLAAEAQRVRPHRGQRRQRVAQLLLRREEGEHDVGRTSGLLRRGEQKLARAATSRQMDGSAPHHDAGRPPRGRPAGQAPSLEFPCLNPSVAEVYARDREGGRCPGVAIDARFPVKMSEHEPQATLLSLHRRHRVERGARLIGRLAGSAEGPLETAFSQAT